MPGRAVRRAARCAALTRAAQGGEARYCNKCKQHKPPRTHHCRQCDRCVLRMDHHCVWLNNCVGHRNYKAFFLFLFCAPTHPRARVRA